MKCATLSLLCLCLLAGCGKSSNPVASSNPTMAEEYAHQVKATPDVTRLENLCVQMPDTIQPDIRYGTGEDRVFTWVYQDDSRIIATFRPTATPGGGLVLYMVEIEK